MRRAAASVKEQNQQPRHDIIYHTHPRRQKHQQETMKVTLRFVLYGCAVLWACWILRSSLKARITDREEITRHNKNQDNKIKVQIHTGKMMMLLPLAALSAPENPFPTAYFGSAELRVASYTPQGGNRFQEWKDGSTPYNTNLGEDPVTQEKSDALARQRRECIKAAAKHAWTGYKTHAFGADEVGPVSGEPITHWGDIGTTLVDALDTLWLMGMMDEFYEARDWVSTNLDHDKDVDASLFETTIRSLGGLLSAFDWSGDRVFLEKAWDLGDRLAKAFDEDAGGRGGIPIGNINLSTGKSSSPMWLHKQLILADVATLPVEFRQLSKHTGKDVYATKAERVFQKLKDIEPIDGLFPDFLTNEGNLKFANNKISFGPYGDSFYEYELKIWLQGGRKEPMYRSMYDKSMDGMHDKKLRVSKDGLTYIFFENEETRMDHLTCFMGGLLALGAWSDPDGIYSERAQRDLKTSKALAYTCYQMYASMPTGLSADVVYFEPNGIRAGTERNYKLRPETVETMFILSSITGDPIYREWGWEIFQSIEKYCKTDIAYGRLHDVTKTDEAPEDSMESFFMAETLKYLYLLMDPDSEVDLEKYVFNTEAHPLKIWND